MKFIVAAEQPSTERKTKVWVITSKLGGVRLGTVGWWSHWRKYVFTPADRTLYEEQCLRDLADFCEQMTNEHKWKTIGSTRIL